MPLRGGESVGQAYVRIYADGSEVPDDIRRSIEDAEPGVRQAGKNHGKVYADNFESETKKQFSTHFGDDKEMFRGLNDNLTEQLSRMEIADTFFEHSLAWKKFLKRLDDEFGAAGRLAGKRLEAEFRDSTDLEHLPDTITDIGVRVRRAQATILDALHDDALRMNLAFDRALTEQDARRNATLRKQEQDTLRAVVSFKNAMTDVAKQVDRLERGESHIGRSRLEEMLETLRDLAPSIATTDHELIHFNDHIETTSKRLREGHPHLSRWRHDMDDLGDTMGRFFGKGSRNNFLNFFGSFVAMLVKFPSKVLFGIADGVSKFGQSVSDAFIKAGGGGAGVLAGAAEGFTQLGGVVLKASGAIVAFLGLLALIALVIGPVVAVISGLVAILLALGSSLIYAASSAAAFFPLLVPVAAIITGIVAAVMDLNGATGELGKTMDSISDKATKLWDTFKSGVGQSKGLAEVLDQANRILDGFGPLTDAAVKGFNRFANEIAEEMSGGAIDKFVDRFTRFLPHAMKDLGTIFGNVFGGLTGLLRGATPAANRLLDWLVKITDRFDKWANSKEGQRDIKQFLDRAADSAHSVGKFLGNAWDWLTKLISKSKGEGDVLWERIGGKFEKWAKWIDDHPDAFEQWMEDADELASSISDAVDGMGKLVDILDSPQNRSSSNFLVSSIGGVLFALGELSRLGPFLMEKIIFGLLDPQGAFNQWANATLDRLEQLGMDIWYVVGGEWVGDLFAGIGAALTGAAGWVAQQFAAFWDAVTSAFAGGGSHGGGAMVIKPQFDASAIVKGIAKLPGLVSKGLDATVGAFRGLASRAAQAAGNIVGPLMAKFSPLANRVGGIVDQMVSKFGNLAERAARALGDVWAQISSKFTSIPGKVATVIDAIVRAFAGLAGRILAMIGPIVIHPTIGSVLGGGAQKAGQDLPASGGSDGLASSDPALRLVASVSPRVVSPSTPGRVVDASGWTIVTPSEDPRIVATEVVNDLIARAV